jgi:hypothetical protein
MIGMCRSWALLQHCSPSTCCTSKSPLFSLIPPCLLLLPLPTHQVWLHQRHFLDRLRSQPDLRHRCL